MSEFEPKAKGEDRETGSTEFSVRKITGDRHRVRTASGSQQGRSVGSARRAREIFHQENICEMVPGDQNSLIE